MVRQVHPLTGQALIADALDLQHRLPLVWARVASLDAEAWVARKVASLTRAVPLAVIDIVDGPSRASSAPSPRAACSR